jgi:hydrogenase expression/formation protein HypC
MCLALPGRVLRIELQHGQPVATVDFDGTTREISVAFVPEVRPGEYVIAHAGVAIQRLDEAAAAETLALLAELGDATETGDPGRAS